MGLISGIVALIKMAIPYIVKIVKFIIKHFDFFANCINWFKSLRLDKRKHIPFVGKANELKEMLGQAPVKDYGIFQGVFDQETEEIVANQFIEADDIDANTRKALGNEDLIVLT